jgi:hypothetical protein
VTWDVDVALMGMDIQLSSETWGATTLQATGQSVNVVVGHAVVEEFDDVFVTVAKALGPEGDEDVVIVEVELLNGPRE